MLQHRKLIERCDYDQKELVYIPMGAEKGDCPYCYYGVLRRDPQVEEIYNLREGYICAKCGVVYAELYNRFFKKLAKDEGLR
jgi:hypothetical protein